MDPIYVNAIPCVATVDSPPVLLYLRAMTRPIKLLILAEDCNPEWPSLPVVGYKYALELGRQCEATVVTHIRNRDNIRKASPERPRFEFVDNEWVARPLYRLGKLLRGGSEVGWSTRQIMAYLPYLEFERKVWQRFGPAVRRGEYDIIHRITPMSPTLPSPIVVWSPCPVVLGPLNGNLDWPREFAEEQAREKEGLRKLRNFYKYLPFTRSTYRGAAAVLAAFSHTRKDLKSVEPERLISFPEIGYDPKLFYPSDSAPKPGRRPPQVHFLFAGRLVPYKLAEVAVRAFAASEALRNHVLHIVGDGPERARLESVISQYNLQSCVHLEGRTSQAGVADRMRKSHVFVFPSIRELGAGVVIEAMAAGLICVVANYGAPGDLAAEGRGIRVPMGPIETMIEGFRQALESTVQDWDRHAEGAERARAYAQARFTWPAKGALTQPVYDWVLRGGGKPEPFGS